MWTNEVPETEPNFPDIRNSSTKSIMNISKPQTARVAVIDTMKSLAM